MATEKKDLDAALKKARDDKEFQLFLLKVLMPMGDRDLEAPDSPEMN